MAKPLTRRSIRIHGVDVPVTSATRQIVTIDDAHDGDLLPDQVRLMTVLASPLLLNWAHSLNPHMKVSRVEIQNVDLIHDRVGFIKIRFTMTFEGKRTTRIVLLRGDSVAIFVVIACEGSRYALMTVQPRPATGHVLVEIPAGMMDGDNNFLGKAAAELWEEARIKINPRNLIDLCYRAQRGASPRTSTPPPASRTRPSGTSGTGWR